jgi:hypothetical protein
LTRLTFSTSSDTSSRIISRPRISGPESLSAGDTLQIHPGVWEGGEAEETILTNSAGEAVPYEGGEYVLKSEDFPESFTLVSRREGVHSRSKAFTTRAPGEFVASPAEITAVGPASDGRYEVSIVRTEWGNFDGVPSASLRQAGRDYSRTLVPRLDGTLTGYVSPISGPVIYSESADTTTDEVILSLDLGDAPLSPPHSSEYSTRASALSPYHLVTYEHRPS